MQSRTSHKYLLKSENDLILCLTKTGGVSMSKLLKAAQAGSVESSDILVMLAPADPGTGILMELTSPTMQQYGDHIKKVILKTLEEQGVTDAIINANEKGALDYTIEARVRTAVKRAAGQRGF
jgi:citrate lyase subunit gamma (acyl carrier protein)